MEAIFTAEEFSKKHQFRFRLTKLSLRWFPLFPSEDLAAVVAALMSDGHVDLQMRGGKPRTTKLVLYSSNPTECKWFIDAIHRLFGVRGKIIPYISSSGFTNKTAYKAVVACSALAWLMIDIGVPCGDKTKKAYPVPHWIMDGSNGVKRSFLRAFFNFDGSISLRSRRENAIEMNLVANKHKDYLKYGTAFFVQIKQLLFEFGVNAGKLHVRHANGDKFTIMLFITNGISIINFRKYVGFLSEEKNNRLELAVSCINKYRRVAGGSGVLNLLKAKVGTDAESIEQINRLSKVKYTKRQFEHMRRGEGLVPLDMLSAAHSLLENDLSGLEFKLASPHLSSQE